MAQKNNELEIKIKELEQKCEEYLLGWKRERADFANYKKDEAERVSDIIKYGNQDLALKIIPILDNFNLASKHADQNSDSTKGFMLIKKQIEDMLAKEGIEEIKCLGKPFDPATMETIGETESSGNQSSAESGTVVEELQKGYTMQGKLIRPAKVKIAK